LSCILISNSKIEQVDFFNFRRFSTLLVTLHDYIFKELLSLPHLASACMMSALRRYRSCFVSLRFRWDCKGRNLFGFSKINVKIYFFCFPDVSAFNLH